MTIKQILFLQSKLPNYRTSRKQDALFFSRNDDDPTFCLLPKSTLWKMRSYSTSNPKTAWILPIGPFTSHFVRLKILKAFQPLYFLSEQGELYDMRYIKTKKGLYLPPFVNVDLSTVIFKGADLAEQEDLLFHPQRSSSFYFKGDTTDRIQETRYLQALKARQEKIKIRALSAFYLFLKSKLDS